MRGLCAGEGWSILTQPVGLQHDAPRGKVYDQQGRQGKSRHQMYQGRNIKRPVLYVVWSTAYSATGLIHIQTRQVSIPTADALAVLGHAADARGVKN